MSLFTNQRLSIMPVVPDKYRGTELYHLVFSELITAARYRGKVTYQEIAQIMGLPLVGSHMGRETGHILGEISEDERANDRPLLSAVAVGVSGSPGTGFFACARELGRLADEGSDAERKFWETERDACYEAWKRRLE